MSITKLMAHQLEGVRFLIDNKGGLVADDMGVGKTILSLAYAKWAMYTGLVDRVLVVCPSALVTNWKNEVQVYYGFEPHIYKPNVNYADNWVTVVSYPLLRVQKDGYFKHLDRLKRCLNGKRLLVILDEAGEVRNPDTKTATACRGLRAPVRVALDGTPIRNRIEDLCGVLQFIDPTIDRDWFFNMFVITQHKEIRLKTGKRVWVKQVVGYKNLEQLNAFLSTRMIRRTKEQCLDLPKKQVIHIPYDISSDNLYTQCLNLAGIDDDPMMVKVIRLQEAASGLNPYDETKQDFKAGEKANLLLQLLASSDGRIIVWFKFYETLRHVKKLLAQKGFDVYEWSGSNSVSRNKQRMGWGESSRGVLLATIGSAGVGLNLVEGQTAIFYETELSPSKNQQAEDRIYRKGQQQPVTVYYLYGRESVEEAITDLLRKKSRTNQAVIDSFTPEEMAEIYRFSYRLTTGE